MNITSGQLNKRITFQAATIQPGEGVTTWTDVCTVWAAVKPLVGNQRYNAKQVDSTLSGKVIIRYRRDIEASMRVKLGERILSISSIINPNESNEFLEIEYSEGLD